MALPSAVTVGALAVVLVAGAVLVDVSADAVLHGSASAPSPSRAAGHASVAPTPTGKIRHPKPRLPRKHSRAHPNAAPTVLVEVYNNSGVTGLAAQKASLLEGAGWNVAATGNWYGTIPANTVYYPPQLHAAARKLAKVLGVLRLRPAVAPMQFDRLTVIFTSA